QQRPEILWKRSKRAWTNCKQLSSPRGALGRNGAHRQEFENVGVAKPVLCKPDNTLKPVSSSAGSVVHPPVIKPSHTQIPRHQPPCLANRCLKTVGGYFCARPHFLP